MEIKPMPQGIRRSLMLINELQGTKCQCGANKKPRQTFCLKCYCRLPERMRRALYSKIGDGYEEAYGEAMAHLHDERDGTEGMI